MSQAPCLVPLTVPPTLLLSTGRLTRQHDPSRLVLIPGDLVDLVRAGAHRKRDGIPHVGIVCEDYG